MKRHPTETITDVGGAFDNSAIEWQTRPISYERTERDVGPRSSRHDSATLKDKLTLIYSPR